MLTLASEHKFRMTVQPTPIGFDLSSVIAVITICTTCLLGFLAYIRDAAKTKQEDRAYKEKERVEFIERIAETTVNKTLDKIFGDINKNIDNTNKNIDILFKYREDDRKHYDTKFDNILKELKK